MLNLSSTPTIILSYRYTNWCDT